MYYSGGTSCGCGNNMNYQMPFYPTYGCGCGNNNNSTYAIILVLFILLVIVIGTRFVG